MARIAHAGRRLDARRSRPRIHRLAAALRREHAPDLRRPNGGVPGALALRPGTSRVVRPRFGRPGDREKLGGSRSVEAIPRRHGRHVVDRPRRHRAVLPPHPTGGQSCQPDVDRVARLFPVGSRGPRQPLFVHTDRTRVEATHPSRRLLRPFSVNRRTPNRLPRGDGHLRFRSPGRGRQKGRRPNSQQPQSTEPQVRVPNPVSRIVRPASERSHGGYRSSRRIVLDGPMGRSTAETRESVERPVSLGDVAARRRSNRRRDRRGRG